MPTRALHMRKIRELVRLKYEARLSHEQIAGALAISKGVIAKYVARIERTKLDPTILMAMSDAEVMARISPTPRPASYGGRIKPDFAHLHAELKRPNMTLTLLWQEYCQANAGGLTFATQAVSGALGVARNEANTCCAQRDASVTKWPTPAN